MSTKKGKEQIAPEKQENFCFRVKMGENEVEIKGSQLEVTKTIENLPNLITNIQKAFDAAKPKTIATITVKTEAPKAASEISQAQLYPKVGNAADCKEAVIRLLETDLGKWRPRTMEELKEAIDASDLKYSIHVLTESLNKLTDKGLVRRWNTNTGFVYILAEDKPLSVRGEA
jgi:hypothetical protein